MGILLSSFPVVWLSELHTWTKDTYVRLPGSIGCGSDICLLSASAIQFYSSICQIADNVLLRVSNSRSKLGLIGDCIRINDPGFF
jgi:hypothetical protein